VLCCVVLQLQEGSRAALSVNDLANSLKKLRAQAAKKKFKAAGKAVLAATRMARLMGAFDTSAPDDTAAADNATGESSGGVGTGDVIGEATASDNGGDGNIGGGGDALVKAMERAVEQTEQSCSSSPSSHATAPTSTEDTGLVTGASLEVTHARASEADATTDASNSQQQQQQQQSDSVKSSSCGCVIA
jgi:hypothetical protein